MSFADAFATPKTTSASTSGWSKLFNSAPVDQAQQDKIRSAASAAQVAKANSEYANSFQGTVVNTAKGVGKSIIDAVKPYIAAPEERVKAIVESIQQGNLEPLKKSLANQLNEKTQIGTHNGQPIYIPTVVENLAQGVAFGEGAAGKLRVAEKAAIAEHPVEPTVTEPTPVAETKKPAAETAKPFEAVFQPEPKTLIERHAEYAKSQGYEPYTPTEQLPVIEAGKAEKSPLPTIQAEAPASKPVKGDLTFEPIKEPKLELPKATKPSVPFSADKAVKEAQAILKPAESLGKTRTSTLAAKVNANAVEKKLTTGLGDLPEYNQVNMKEQAQFASDLVHYEPEKAMRIAMGQEAPPAHILPESVFTAIEDAATKAGDVETLHKLATESNLSTQATAMGQRIRALAERDQESPISRIHEVKKARTARVTSRRAKAEVESIKNEIKKAAPKRQDWESFIKEVTCNY